LFSLLKVVKYFVEKGVNIHAKNVLLAVVNNSKLEVVKFLMEKGVNINRDFVLNCKKWSKISTLKMKTPKNYLEIVKYLSSKKCQYGYETFF